MKLKYILISLASLALASCAGLAGTSIGFTESGFTITPPVKPIEVPYPAK